MNGAWVNLGQNETRFDFDAVEAHYDATFVGHFCLRSGNGWTEDTYPVFHQPNHKPEHSGYFTVYARGNQTFIANASCVAEGEWNGVMADDGEIIFSRSRHDYRTSRDGTATVDGGRDYFKHSGGRVVRLQVIGPTIEVIGMDDES